MKLSEQVKALEESKDAWESLCREIMATLLIEGNKEVFAVLPATWHEIVGSWHRQLEKIAKNETGPLPGGTGRSRWDAGVFSCHGKPEKTGNSGGE